MSSITPLLGNRHIKYATVRELADQMILSASGWRTVFAADGSEESKTTEVRAEHLILVALAARTFLEFLRPDPSTSLLVARDSRPTGQLLARAAIAAFSGTGAPVRYLGIAPIPEVMSYTAQEGALAGFFYVSASHNPIGHNGLKMGGRKTGVIGGDAMDSLIEQFLGHVSSDDSIDQARRVLSAPAGSIAASAYSESDRFKNESARRYREFTLGVLTGDGPFSDEAADCFLKDLPGRRPFIVCDQNGSARSASIDAAFLKSIGCQIHFFNDAPGEIEHQIVPEGAGLEPCRDTVERLASGRDPLVHGASPLGEIIGYVPDNDGDRGNLVYHDGSNGARQIDAQTVFALACVAELSWLRTIGLLDTEADGHRPVAVVVNGPTSMRIDRIAEAFGVEVHRVEVGEANVVAKAKELQSQGRIVRILGEGSNGGNITFPAAVRDPLNTVMSLLKLLYAPATTKTEAPLNYWLKHSGQTQNDPAAGEVSLADLVNTLPAYTTTSAFEAGAVMRIGNEPQSRIKGKVEESFPTEFESFRTRLEKELGVVSYQFVNYEGTNVLAGKGNRTGSETGGFKILLEDRSGIARAFLWMRGSKTEPVFRVMVDVEGERPELEQDLLDWLRSLVANATGGNQSS